MWRYYRRTFWAVQLFAVAVSWLVYRTTKPFVGPSLLFFFFMQASGVLGALWAHRLGKKLQGANAACAMTDPRTNPSWKTR